MSEQGELRSCREERMENGVKNLKGARLYTKTSSTNGIGNAYYQGQLLEKKELIFYHQA